MKAGTHEIAATFLKDTILPEGILARVRDDQVQAHHEGVGTITVAGPYKVQGPGVTPSREKIFICRPAARTDEEACAEKILANLAHHAYRRPVTADDMQQLLGLYRQGAQSAGFEVGRATGAAEGSGVACVHLPRGVRRAGCGCPGAPIGSAISSWPRGCPSSCGAAFPDDELLAVAESGQLSDRRCWRGQVKRMLADPRSHDAGQEFHRPVAVPAQYREDLAGSGLAAEFRREPAPVAGEGNRASGRKHGARGSQRRRSPEARTTPSSISAWPSTTGSRASTATSSAA